MLIIKRIFVVGFTGVLRGLTQACAGAAVSRVSRLRYWTSDG